MSRIISKINRNDIDTIKAQLPDDYMPSETLFLSDRWSRTIARIVNETEAEISTYAAPWWSGCSSYTDIIQPAHPAHRTIAWVLGNYETA